MPGHTFADLAAAVDAAFACWDRAHLAKLTLADGSLVSDRETIEEWEDSLLSPPPRCLELGSTRVARTVERGGQFSYVFDFGDAWTHCCTVETEYVDPEAALGVVPAQPMAVWGWGTVPDQYGRRWADDDGSEPVPPRPQGGHPMLSSGWPEAAPPAVDLRELRSAVARRDAAAIVAAVRNHDVSEMLQQVGAALEVAVVDEPAALGLAADVMLLAERRGWAGDAELVEDLSALVRGQQLAGRELAVDLEELAELLEGDITMSSGGFLDLHTGEVIPESSTDPAMVGEEWAIDVEADPDRWLRVACFGSRDGWNDMADFASDVRDAQLRERLEVAIAGRGAFRRFKDVVYDAGLGEAWYAFSAERQIGRAREYLAGVGIRVRP